MTLICNKRITVWGQFEKRSRNAGSSCCRFHARHLWPCFRSNAKRLRR